MSFLYSGLTILKEGIHIKVLLKYCAVVVMILFSFGCTKKPPAPEKSLNEKLNFSYSDYATIFQNQLLSIDGYILQQDSLITYYDTLKYFYSLRDYQPSYIKSFEDAEIVYSIIPILEKAVEHGLNPEQYHFSDIINNFTGATDTVANLSRYYLLAMTELLVSDAILKYSQHLRYGLVNPKELFSDTYFLPIVDSSKGDLLEPLRQENLVQYLDDIQPTSKRYRALQEALKYYSRFEELDWPTVTVLAQKIEVGSRDVSVPQLVKKLIMLEYLDTSKNKITDPLLYDSLVAGAIKSFQRDNGLNDDGIIGKNTIERLNTTPHQYIEKIKINLERFRWNEYADSTKYILVNIPDFMLYIFENGEEVFKSMVCTGSKRPKYFASQMEVYKETELWSDKPDDWETPNLYGKISYLVLNPTWNVPQSIMREEIVYKMKKDSSYLSSHNFKVYLDTLELNPDSIKISDLSVEKIPYKIIQDPGAGNALGKIKFIFYNRHGIYLHDTPNRSAFKYDNRGVSHGCIRVENPIPLAEFLLRDHPKWNIDFLKIEIGLRVDNKEVVKEYEEKRESLRKYASLGKTTDVILPQKVQLYIDYYTAWVDDDDVINFRADVYDRDKVLIEYLSANQLF